jgi:hypothetical protein
LTGTGTVTGGGAIDAPPKVTFLASRMHKFSTVQRQRDNASTRIDT